MVRAKAQGRHVLSHDLMSIRGEGRAPCPQRAADCDRVSHGPARWGQRASVAWEATSPPTDKRLWTVGCGLSKNWTSSPNPGQALAESSRKVEPQTVRT